MQRQLEMHQHRRRKKRPNYGIRTVDVTRGLNGFGFTISGQQPCILSCIVANSPADLAGLRAGDFLISVNGLNVSRFPHEAVVQLIGNFCGTIRMAIAENYYSDSSDEDQLNASMQSHHRAKPKYGNHKVNRVQRIGRKAPDLKPVKEASFTSPGHNIIPCPTASTSRDISNVSAMVRPIDAALAKEGEALEYRAVVGYLGTIEMPKQIATSSKLQTVRSCIRKMRQEKRQPVTVLMTILPSCLILCNQANAVLAKYPANRLSYVSTSSETDTRFFGLVTSAVYADGHICDTAAITDEAIVHRKDVAISNSCHVFVIDGKLVEHGAHGERAEIFKISCTQDLISGTCLEFPATSDYVVNLICSMYTLKTVSPTMRQRPATVDEHGVAAALAPHAADNLMVANSPQPSNHSETTTTSSNSDSGIGFHNDCANISDRILVVDFPGLLNPHFGKPRVVPLRPCGIINELSAFEMDPIRNIRSKPDVINGEEGARRSLHMKSHSVDSSLVGTSLPLPLPLPLPSTSRQSDASRLTVRAMPDPSTCGAAPQERAVDVPDVLLFEFSRNSLMAARSCDDIIMSYERASGQKYPPRMSIDDISMLSDATATPHHTGEHIFLPPKPPKKRRPKTTPPPPNGNKDSDDNLSCKSTPRSDYRLLSYKLSPKVFGLARPVSMSSADGVLPHYVKKKKPLMKSAAEPASVWGSLQELRDGDIPTGGFLTGTYSAPDLNFDESRAITNGNGSGGNGGGSGSGSNGGGSASPFRRWGQASFRSRSNESHTASNQHLRPASLAAASENDVYTKSIDNGINSAHHQHHQHDCNVGLIGAAASADRGPDHNRTNTNSIGMPTAMAVSVTQTTLSSTAGSGTNGMVAATAATMTTTTTTTTTTTMTTGSSAYPDGGCVSWSTSFERLLDDPSGLHTFAEFLKKEFSAENIYFWTACERYRHMADNFERSNEAANIFAKHLGCGASEPVNVDSQARITAQENLQTADCDLFTQAQKQICNLMKFDSYPRFIRSDLYKSCLDAEAKNRPLPFPGDQLDIGLRTAPVMPMSSASLSSSSSSSTSGVQSKLKKSLSNAEDRRRKSLLPWHRKTRCKSKDRGDEQQQKSDKSSNNGGGGGGGGGGSGSATLKIHQVSSSRDPSDIHSSRSSLSSFDAAISSSQQQLSEDSAGGGGTPRSSLCRVLLTDGATTIVQTRHHESIRDLVERLLEKRGIAYHYEAFLAGHAKPLDLDSESTQLAGCEVQIERRVIFKLDLPNRKVISVKSKPCKALGDVLRPILHKYNYRLDLVQVALRTTNGSNGGNDSAPSYIEMLDMSLPVTVTDGQRLQIVCKMAESWQGEMATSAQAAPSGHYLTAASGSGIVKTTQLPAATAKATAKDNVNGACSSSSSSQQSTLDEITNKVFNELLQGKVDSHAGQGLTREPRPSEQGSIRSDDWGSETSSGIFNRLRRRDSAAPNGMRVIKAKKMPPPPGVQKSCLTADSEDTVECGSKKPLIAKWKAGVKLQVTTRSENHDLLEGLKRAQRSRLEDQRGTEINFELPDFLKDKENFNNNNCNGNNNNNNNSNNNNNNNNNNSSSSSNNISHTNAHLSKLRKTRPFTHQLNETSTVVGALTKPLPAPRLSISPRQVAGTHALRAAGGNDDSNSAIPFDERCPTVGTSSATASAVGGGFRRSPSDDDEDAEDYDDAETSGSTTGSNETGVSDQGSGQCPPPLPPKPKILPMRPSNWGQASTSVPPKALPPSVPDVGLFKVPVELPRRLGVAESSKQQRNVYLDQPSSSFV